MEESAGIITIPEVMFAMLIGGMEMSITVDKDIRCECGEKFLIACSDSIKECEVEVLRIVRGPATNVFEAVNGEPAQSGASVLDAIEGLAMTKRPPTTSVTFLRVKAVRPRPN